MRQFGAFGTVSGGINRTANENEPILVLLSPSGKWDRLQQNSVTPQRGNNPGIENGWMDGWSFLQKEAVSDFYPVIYFPAVN